MVDIDPDQGRKRHGPIVGPPRVNPPPRREHEAIEDQFFLGKDMVVAPVLEAGATSRSVVLPKGKWKAWQGDGEFEGHHKVSKIYLYQYSIYYNMNIPFCM